MTPSTTLRLDRRWVGALSPAAWTYSQNLLVALLLQKATPDLMTTHPAGHRVRAKLSVPNTAVATAARFLAVRHRYAFTRTAVSDSWSDGTSLTLADTGERPFVCQESNCGRSFSVQVRLNHSYQKHR